MTTLILVRHGETDWNRDRRIQGTTDIPLNDTGRAQARATAVSLRGELTDASNSVVISSDLSRAIETAEIIADGLGVARGTQYRELRERAYGAAEGVDTEEFIQRWGDWHSAEIDGAESWPVLRQRAIGGLRRAVRDARRQAAPASPTVIIVTHGALMREVIRHATSGELPVPGERLANGATFTFLMERERLSMLTYAGSPL